MHHSRTCRALSMVVSEIPVCTLMEPQKTTYELGMISTHTWENKYVHICFVYIYIFDINIII